MNLEHAAFFQQLEILAQPTTYTNMLAKKGKKTNNALKVNKTCAQNEKKLHKQRMLEKNPKK